MNDKKDKSYLQNPEYGSAFDQLLSVIIHNHEQHHGVTPDKDEIIRILVDIAEARL